MNAQKARQWHEVYLNNYRNFFVLAETTSEKQRTEKVLDHHLIHAQELVKNLKKLPHNPKWIRLLLKRLSTYRRLFVSSASSDPDGDKVTDEESTICRKWYKQDLIRVARALLELSDRLTIESRRPQLVSAEQVSGKQHKQRYEKLSTWQQRLLHSATEAQPDVTVATNEFSNLTLNLDDNDKLETAGTQFVTQSVILIGNLRDQDLKKLHEYAPERLADLRQQHAGLGHHYMSGYLVLRSAKLYQTETVKTWQQVLSSVDSNSEVVHKKSIRRHGHYYWLVFPRFVNLGSLDWGLT